MEDISFGPFTIDQAGSRLLRDGVDIRLRPQAFLTLRALALHGGRYLGYDQLIAEAWRGVIVSRHTVDVTVAEIRRTLQDYGSWIKHRPKGGYCLEIPRSDLLVRRGWHFWHLRTRDGFEKALECFQQAAVEGPRDHRAFEGQSVCYLMLASQGMRPGREMYPNFLAAHRRAVAIAGHTPELRCDRAHGLHMYERRLSEAEAEFEYALREKPTLASAYVRLTMLYTTLGRLDEAVECVGRAYEADPLQPLLPATETSVWFWRRDFDKAVALGARATELHPYGVIGHAYYAHALEFAGRLEQALAEYHIGQVISGGLPWLRASEAVCRVKLGRHEEARAILHELEALRTSDYVDAYGMALLRRALGEHDAAFAELERAVDEGGAGLYALNVDPRADAFRTDPRFDAVLRRLFGDQLAGSSTSDASSSSG